MALSVAVQMDPIERINIRGDSTFAMLLEAVRSIVKKPWVCRTLPTCERRLSPRKSSPLGWLTLRCGPLYIVGLARLSGCLPGPFTAMQHKRRIAVVALESVLWMVMIAARSCGATAPAGNSR